MTMIAMEKQTLRVLEERLQVVDSRVRDAVRQNSRLEERITAYETKCEELSHTVHNTRDRLLRLEQQLYQLQQHIEAEDVDDEQEVSDR